MQVDDLFYDFVEYLNNKNNDIVLEKLHMALYNKKMEKDGHHRSNSHDQSKLNSPRRSLSGNESISGGENDVKGLIKKM